MGKYIDFTQLGGMPLTQDRLLFLQEAWNEQCAALGAIGGAGPYIVVGCTYTRTLVTGTTYAYALAPGWIYYNDALQRVPGNTVNVDESVDAAYIELTTVDTPLSFYNGSTPGVVQDTTGAVVGMPIGVADSGTLFLLSELVAWGYVPFTDVAGGDFGSGCANDGTPFYNVGWRVVDNMLELCGMLVGTTLASTATLMTLPVSVASKMRVWVYTNGLGAYNMIEFDTDGTVKFNSGGGGSGLISLDGVRVRLS